jgi:hypothetical protein
MPEVDKVEEPMTWAELEWPPLGPDLPEPRPTTPPPVPPAGVSQRIARVVERRERRRAWGVKLLVLAGALLVGAGVALYAAGQGAEGRASPTVLALLGVGLLVAFPGAALAALWLGPTWRQRQEHYQLARWQREQRAWLARERERYLASLTAPQRAEVLRRLDASASDSLA